MVNENKRLMGRIASKAFYLATPLAFAAHPAVAKSVMLVAPNIAGPTLGEAGPIRAYVIVDGPPIMRFDRDKSLGAAISEEVRQRIIERPEGAPETPSSTGAVRLTDFTIVDDGDAAESGDVVDAVIAAHVERISVLQQRMDALRAKGGAADRIADLRIRLHRAEAARRLAVARASVDKLASAGCGSDADAVCRSGLDAVVSAQDKVRVASRSSIVSRRAIASQRPAIVAGASSGSRRSAVKTAKVVGWVGAHYPLTLASTSTRVSVRAADESFRSSRIAIDLHVAQHNPFATRLTHARRSLAVARKLLERGVERVPRTSVKPIVRTVGLWRWPGSEQWSLTSTRSRTV